MVTRGDKTGHSHRRENQDESANGDEDVAGLHAASRTHCTIAPFVKGTGPYPLMVGNERRCRE